MPFTIVTQGTFLSTGVGVKIPLPSSADYFKTYNLTQMPLAPATAVVVMAEWFGSGLTAANDGLRWKKSTSTSAMNLDTFATSTASNGFTYVTTAPTVEPQAANAITGITAANPAVVTQTNTYSNGDILRIYGTTGDLTIGGMDFQISSVSGSGYTLLGLANIAGNGLAAATAGFTRRISTLGAVEPESLYITNISQATQAVISTSVDPSVHYAVGMKIHFTVPSSFGMKEMDQLTGTIVAVNAVAASGNIGAYNVTVDIDSTAFTAFAFPLTTSSPTAALFATLSPAGARTKQDPVTGIFTGYDFNLQPFRTGEFTPYMFLAGGAQSPAGASADRILWQAFKMETGTINI
jgi:hypothetical protein